MTKRNTYPVTWALGGIALTAALVFGPMTRASAETAVLVPALEMPEAKQTTATSEKIVLAGGCFWGVQGVFQHVKGVTSAVSGYAGGKKETAEYEVVSSGITGHAESVEVTYDPRLISLGAILQIYFSVAHNPTELNFQGPDTGTQYRSAIFFANETQKQIAGTYIAQLNKAHVFQSPIVTSLEPLDAFYAAETYHQDYATLHPNNGYIAYNDLPKIENLSRLFPNLYRAKPKLVAASNISN